MVDKSHKVDWKGLTVDATDFTVNGTSIATVGGTENVSTLNLGASGTVGTLNAYPTTASKGRIRIVPTDNTGNTILDITNAAQGQATTLTIPDVGAATGTFSLLEKAETYTAQKTFAAGTTAIAPYKLQSGTNLTTAAAGAIEFDGKTFYATSVASSRQVIPVTQFCVLTADYTASDSAAAQKVFNSSTNGALTVAASTSYFFEALYRISNTGTTAHTWSTLFGGTATFTGIFYDILARTGTTSAATITAMSSLASVVATATVVTASSTSATEFVNIRLTGIMEINGAGTVIPQFQASAQPGQTGTPGVTVLKGSYFKMTAVGTDAVATVGNWS